jgi:hypothetical protein
MPPNWTLTGRLHSIPDSTDAFTGYSIGLDVIGADLLGLGAANQYVANGQAEIRNVPLPAGANHSRIMDTRKFLQQPDVITWINQYAPTNKPALDVELDADPAQVIFAADAWHDIRKHWVMELQRVLRAERAAQHER